MTKKPQPNDQIDLALFKIAFPSTNPVQLTPWIEPIKAACKEFGIDTVREVASFLANIAVESQDLKALSESLNYSVEGLLKTFGRHRISEQQCRALGRSGARPANQRMIANILYGGEFGRKNLGNVHPDDGWTFRGQGLKQLTGRYNHERCAKALGIPMTQWPAYIQSREGAARSAGFFWKDNNMDALAATPGVADDRKKINGGTLGLELVEKRFDALIKELLKRGC
jgi:putative chitinase